MSIFFHETTLKELQRIFLNDTSDEFIFVISNFSKSSEITYVRSTINKARAISARVEHLFQCDPTISSFTINVPIILGISDLNDMESDVKVTMELYEQVLGKLLESTTCQVEISNDKEKVILEILYNVLDNESFFDEIEKKEIESVEHAISFSKMSPAFRKRAVEYLADHFSEFIEKISDFNINEMRKDNRNFFDFEKFIKNNNFIEKKSLMSIHYKICETDFLYDVVDAFIEKLNNFKELSCKMKDPEKRQFYNNLMKNLNQVILFLNNDENFDADKICNSNAMDKKARMKLMFYIIFRIPMNFLSKEFVPIILNNINDQIIEKDALSMTSFLKNLLFSSFDKENNLGVVNVEDHKVIEIDEKDDNELDGIISYIQKCKENDIESNYKLTVSAGGYYGNRNGPSNVIQYGNLRDSAFYNYYGGNFPVSEDGSWIEFDFGEKNEVNLSSYTIRTNGMPQNCNHPKSWRIVGSNNKKQWVSIDHRVDLDDLNGSFLQHRFYCKSNNNSFRYIRFIQENSHGEHQFNVYLTCIEFFGNYYEN